MAVVKGLSGENDLGTSPGLLRSGGLQSWTWDRGAIIWFRIGWNVGLYRISLGGTS